MKKTEFSRAPLVQMFASLIERQSYPVNAKYFLQLEGLPITLHTRVRDPADLTSAGRLEVQQFRAMTQRATAEFGM